MFYIMFNWARSYFIDFELFMLPIDPIKNAFANKTLFFILIWGFSLKTSYRMSWVVTSESK